MRELTEQNCLKVEHVPILTKALTALLRELDVTLTRLTKCLNFLGWVCLGEERLIESISTNYTNII